MFELKSTLGISCNGVKGLIFGPPGAGKTYLSSTAPNPLIISAESGLLSLNDFQLPYLTVTDIASFMGIAHGIATDPILQQFQTYYVDSLSEIAEVCLIDRKSNNKDPRKAYGETQEKILEVVRWFRDSLPGKNVIFTAKEEPFTDGFTTIYRPSFPGKQLPKDIPYFFDEVFQIQSYTDPVTGTPYRAIRTFQDDRYYAKDRSGKLEPFERPDLNYIFNKIQGNLV